MPFIAALKRPLAACLACLAGAAHAQSGPTPAAYFECQIAARQATVAGIQEWRAFLIKSARATEAQRQAAADALRNKVTQAFTQCGYSANQLGAYAHRNADLLQGWLAENPQVQARLEAEAQRVASLVDQATPPDDGETTTRR